MIRSRALASLLLVGVLSTSAAAAEPPNLFRTGTEALEHGRIGDAIADFEELADRGVVNASASFDRGLAYLRRAESPEKKPGDLGQAVAGFAEALERDGSDAEAQSLLEEARLRIARSRSKNSDKPVLEVTPLSSRVLRALPEGGLVYLAGALSLLAAAALLGLLLDKRASKNTARIACILSVALLSIVTLLLASKRQHEASVTPAIVVSGASPLLDELGRPIAGVEPLSEGAYVEVGPRKGALVRIDTEAGSRFVRNADLRRLAR